MKILVVGSSNTDHFIRLKSLPKPGETVSGGIYYSGLGGKGANQAVAARRLGSEVSFVCKLGKDAQGEAARQSFEQEGLDTSYVFSTDGLHSGVAFILVDEQAENSIAVAAGANSDLMPEDIDRIGNIQDYRVILTSLEIPMETVRHLSGVARRHGIPLILNPAPAPKEPLPPDILAAATIVTPNETEISTLSGVPVHDEGTAVQAASAFRALGAREIVVTLGQKGALVSDGRPGTEMIPSFSVPAIDTTGAGDIFNAALAVGLAERMDLRKAVRFAAAASAISVTRRGAMPSAPFRKEVEHFLATH